MRAPRTMVLAALALNACYFGAQQGSFRPAQTALGAQLTIDRRLHAELLVVTDSGFLVRGDFGALRFARFSLMRSADFAQLGASYDWWRGRPVNGEYLARVRLIARYPQGLAPDQLAELLRLSGQSEPAGLP